jgi:hypothetical protein
MCGRSMQFYRELPKLGSRPRLTIFACDDCCEFETRAPEIARQDRRDLAILA